MNATANQRRQGLAPNILLVSAYFPPIVGGTSTVVRNLLGAFRPECAQVISELPTFLFGQHNAEPPPGIEVQRVGLPACLKKIPYLNKYLRWGRFLMIPRVRNLIIRSARRTAPQYIVAVYPSWPFLIAAYQAAAACRIPLITYYMDAS